MYKMVTALAAVISCALVGALWAQRARAQPATPTISPNASPIVISQQPEKIAARPKVEDYELINVAFGATVNAGNSKAFSGSLGGRFGLIRGHHQLTLEGLGTMGGARERRFTDVDWTSRTMIGRARYDIFLSTADALFVAVAPRRDKEAGFDIRLQNQVGYLRNLFHRTDSHRFWTELGYDFTYDNFAPVEKTETVDITDQVRMDEMAAGVPIGSSFVPADAAVTRTVVTPGRGDDDAVHSARILFGYTNRLFASASFSVWAETLLDFTNIDNVRVNGLAELTSSITHSFKLGLQSRLLFDNDPVTNTDKYDAIVAVQLVYTFDSLGGALNAPCPVCDCTAQVEAARAACRNLR